jgi:diacylglycerol diphosphate phosphatase/phosphatidate phosphatase
MPSSESHHDPRKTKPSANTTASLLEAARRFWQKSYAGDYLGLALLTTAYFLLKLTDEPFHQAFSLSDTRIQHPYAVIERVPVFWLFIYAGGIPAIVLLLWTLILRRDLHKAHVTLLGLAITIITTCFLTDIFKDAVGRPRPDVLARCKPRESSPTIGLVTIDVCTETNHHILHDGFRSWPSGHSSFSFAGLGWLAFFMASQFHAMRPRASLITVILAASPLVVAAFIAISRLEDYRHDVFDVTCGSILGFLVTCSTWLRYYPSLWSSSCDDPFRPLTSGGKDGFERVRDEEEGYATTEERFSISEDAGGLARRDTR